MAWSNKSLVMVPYKPSYNTLKTLKTLKTFKTLIPSNPQTFKTLKLIYSNEKPSFQLLQISNKKVATKAT